MGPLPQLLAEVPSFESARLSFRGHRREDLDDCAAMWGDAAVVRHISGIPSTVEEVWARLLRYVGHWAVMGYGFWVVREKSSGRFIGEVGFADFRRALDPPLDAPEAGWVLAPWAHGQGFATEALRAALAWGDAHLGSSRSVCMIDPENAPSIRVAEKCGYREMARTTYKGMPTVLFER